MSVNKENARKASDQQRATIYALKLKHAVEKKMEGETLYSVFVKGKPVAKDATLFECARFGMGYTFYQQG